MKDADANYVIDKLSDRMASTNIVRTVIEKELAALSDLDVLFILNYLLKANFQKMQSVNAEYQPTEDLKKAIEKAKSALTNYVKEAELLAMKDNVDAYKE